MGRDRPEGGGETAGEDASRLIAGSGRPGMLTRNRPAFHPELLVWLPNVLFFVIGAFRFSRLARR